MITKELIGQDAEILNHTLHSLFKTQFDQPQYPSFQIRGLSGEQANVYPIERNGQRFARKVIKEGHFSGEFSHPDIEMVRAFVRTPAIEKYFAFTPKYWFFPHIPVIKTGLNGSLPAYEMPWSEDVARSGGMLVENYSPILKDRQLATDVKVNGSEWAKKLYGSLVRRLAILEKDNIHFLEPEHGLYYRPAKETIGFFDFGAAHTDFNPKIRAYIGTQFTDSDRSLLEQSYKKREFLNSLAKAMFGYDDAVSKLINGVTYTANNGGSYYQIVSAALQQ